MKKYLVILFLVVPIRLVAGDNPPCPKAEQFPKLSKKKVYEGKVFQPGEEAIFEVSYLGAHAGDAIMQVRPPMKIDGVWHHVFYGEANTGDWYEHLFVMRDKILAHSNPHTYEARKFYIEQFEKAVFKSPYERKKWLDFGRATCQVEERVLKDKKESNDKFFFQPLSNDALSAYYNLRNMNLVKGKTINLPVYSSEKNWKLEAIPIEKENLEFGKAKVPAIKLKLQTYLGQELQQKGDIYMWIATDHPAKPLLQIKGEVKIGTIWIKLKSFKSPLGELL